jgi:hypothetical protein
MKQTLASGLLGALGAMTAYLVLERSHAEEIGGGSRVFAEVVRGERPLAAPTWLALAAVAVALAVAGRNRAEAPVRAHRGR